MKIRIVALVCVLFGSAVSAWPKGEPPPEAYLDLIDQQIARTGQGLPGRPYACEREVTNSIGRYVERKPTEECVRMDAPRRWSGIWRNDFEGSMFCPDPASTCDFDKKRQNIWLTERPNRRGDQKSYRVVFVGRRTWAGTGTAGCLITKSS